MSSYTLKNFLGGSHQIIADMPIQAKVHSILDVGCGEGFLGRSLKYHPRKLIGIDKKDLDLKKYGYTSFIMMDLDKSSPVGLKNKDFDVIVLADILEHLKMPLKLTLYLKSKIHDAGFFIISVPNMDFLPVRILLGLGIRPRMKKGPFDASHRRDYTLGSLKAFLSISKLKIINVKFTPIPLPVFTRSFAKGGYLYFIYKIFTYLSQKFPPLLPTRLLSKLSLKCFPVFKDWEFFYTDFIQYKLHKNR